MMNSVIFPFGSPVFARRRFHRTTYSIFYDCLCCNIDSAVFIVLGCIDS